MNPWKPLCGLCLLILLCIAPSRVPAEKPDLRVAEMAVTTKIFKGNPIDSIGCISSSSVRALYCFTRIDSPTAEETSVKHVWYHDGEVVGEYDLPVKGKRWRTYSKKLIEKGEVGMWRVEAKGSEGNVLKSVDFRIN
jgi:hypothetical protein